MVAAARIGQRPQPHHIIVRANLLCATMEQICTRLKTQNKAGFRSV
jgi:hypothetical protein